MRCVRVLFSLIGLAVLLVGCDSLDRRYFREGIGSDLSTADLPQETQLQEQYIGYICRQAGLPLVEVAQGVPACGIGPADVAGWTMFVQAGLNDIDKRCDAYLMWLDARRRFSSAAQQQISDTRTATEAIMGFTGGGPKAIAVVGSAFGFAAATFTNLNSRLLLEVNHSTVQSLVLNRQTDYREGLKVKLIPDRPAAIYALRSYLRLCMPMTIETEINTTITSVERNDRVPLRPLITPATLPTAATIVQPTPLPPATMAGALTAVERVISLSSGRALQRTLCAPETGIFDPTTREQIAAFNEVYLATPDQRPSDTLRTDADLRRLRDARARFSSCTEAGFRNGYEVGLFTRFGADRIWEDFKVALRTAGLTPPSALRSSGVVIDSVARKAIGDLRAQYKMSGPAAFDRAFFTKMMDSIAR